MPTSPMTVRLDSQVKKQFDALCQQFGMSGNTAINIFVNQVVRDRSIPFQITVNDPPQDSVRERAKAAFRRQRDKAERGETSDLPLEEINEEIRQARIEMKQKREAVAV